MCTEEPLEIDKEVTKKITKEKEIFDFKKSTCLLGWLLKKDNKKKEMVLLV